MREPPPFRDAACCATCRRRDKQGVVARIVICLYRHTLVYCWQVCAWFARDPEPKEEAPDA